MDFDSVLSTYLGDFGSYQKRIYFLVCLPAVYCALNSFTWTFTGADIPHRCALSPEDRDFGNPLWNGSGIPGALEGCRRVRLDGELEPCLDGFVWDNSERAPSALQDWELVCDRSWLKAMVQSVYYLGIFGGSLCVGYLSDRFGRKVVLLGGSVLLSLSSCLCAACPDVWSFLGVRFLQGFFEPAVWQVAFVIGVELVGPSKRLLAGLVIEYFFSLGMVVMGVVAWAFPGRWQFLQVAVSAPGFLFLAYIWMMPESPRWLLANGRREPALDILRTAAVVNRRDLPEDVLQDMKCSDGEKEGHDGDVSYWSLVRTPNLRKKTLIMCYCWAIVTLVYYGISLNPSALAGDFYLSFILSASTEFVGVTFLIFTLNRLGRRAIQTAGFLLSGVALIGVLCVPAGWTWLTLCLVMLAKVGNLMPRGNLHVSVVSAFCTIYLYTSEIFPTVIRGIAIGLCSTCARIGGIASPFASLFMDEEDNKLVLLGVFGTSSILAALLSLMLPETTNRRLPETLEDGENFASSRDELGDPGFDKKNSEQPLVAFRDES